MDEVLQNAVLKRSNARGLAVIMCNDYKGTKFENLCGTFEDGRAMESTFKYLGFATITLQNTTADKMCGIIKALATHDPYPKGYNCFVVVFSGHGDINKTIVSNDGQRVNIEEDIIQPRSSISFY